LNHPDVVARFLRYIPVVIDPNGAEARLEISDWSDATTSKNDDRIISQKQDVVISMGDTKVS
jgi:hypothetical protein